MCQNWHPIPLFEHVMSTFRSACGVQAAVSKWRVAPVGPWPQPGGEAEGVGSECWTECLPPKSIRGRLDGLYFK